MLFTGIIRRMDDLGRIVIPKEIRRTIRVKEGDPLELYVDGDSIVLRKHNSALDVKSALTALSSVVDDADELSCKTDILMRIHQIEACLNEEGELK